MGIVPGVAKRNSRPGRDELPGGSEVGEQYPGERRRLRMRAPGSSAARFRARANAGRAAGLAAGERRYRRPPCSTQYRLVSDKVSEGRTEEPSTVRIARAGV